MVKVWVRIPDRLYREAKRIADEYEITFAEVVGRGLERVIPAFPERDRTRPWSLPVLDLGLRADPFGDPGWRAAANVIEGAGDRKPQPPSRRRSR
jgi:hypothetical protein